MPKPGISTSTTGEGTTVTSDGIELRRAANLDDEWDTPIEIYAEVRADQLHQPHY
jgi:hypothetical protein